MDAAIHWQAGSLENATHFEGLVCMLGQSEIFSPVIEHDAIPHTVTQPLCDLSPNNRIVNIRKGFTRGKSQRPPVTVPKMLKISGGGSYHCKTAV